MAWFGTLVGVAMILLILLDSFETTVLPRRVTHRFRFARIFYLTTWQLWRAVASWLPAGEWREAFLGVFGPLSLLGLIASWVLGLVFGFALLGWSLELPLHAPEVQPTFGTYLYMSGITFFTLGYGDVTPSTMLGRALAVTEAGLGFGFLAVIISYLPVIYQIFSRREVLIALLDARAGSPPSAAQFLHRLAQSRDVTAIDSFLAEWERWSAELLESHLSFPMLALYRSQHSNQSWLSALTAILDTSAFLIVAVKGHNTYQAQLTFAMARHAVVDLALVFKAPPIIPEPDRLSASQLQKLRKMLGDAGLALQEGPAIDAKLAELRGMYEPFVNALGQRFLFILPPFVPDEASADNWQRSAWMKRAPDLESLPIAATGDGHFD
jgi:Ion channel